MKRNIVVLGDTGSGKSSLINMLMGKDVAATSSRALGCTFQSEAYNDGFGNKIFDTVGLNEPKQGKVPAKEAYECLKRLLSSLRSGVNLIIFVLRKGRITDTAAKNYKMFARGICQGRVPVLLAISGCEADLNEGAWYIENKEIFARNGMKFDEVVSGCFKEPTNVTNKALREEILVSYTRTRDQLQRLIQSGKYDQSISFGSFMQWIQMIWKDIFEDFSAGHSGSDQLEPFNMVTDNEQTINKQEYANSTMQSKTKNFGKLQRTIIVFGDNGTGKSSLKTMLQQHDDGVDNQIHLMDANEDFNSLQKKVLSMQSGVNLILFVVKKGCTTERMERNYKMINGICQKKVPVLLAVSGCETDKREDNWYNNKKDEFAKKGMKFDADVSGCFKQPNSVTNEALKKEIWGSYIRTQNTLAGWLQSGKYDNPHSIGGFVQ